MYYKLTNQNMQTHNGFQWELGKWYRIPDNDRGFGLCSNSWFHCYNHPLLAILFNPIHANISNPKLFKVTVKGKKESDKGLKFGFSMMKLIEEIPLPKISLNHRVIFGILCAKQVYKNKDWNQWADNWLNGKDRNYTVAYDAYDVAYDAYDVAYDAYAAASAAAYAAYHVARADAYNAARAVRAARAARAARAGYDAARAAAYAAVGAIYAATDVDINLIELAKQAMKYK